MPDSILPDPFLADLPVFRDFAQVADSQAYRPLPDDWTIGLADVVGSTEAIAAGRYKAVNMAGAAVIAAVSNALDHADFPFAFGGDGASFAVPPGWAEAAGTALAATAAFVGAEFGLALRVAAVPMAAIRAAGRDVTLARFAASPDVAYAMFAGGGLAWAESRMKAGAFGLPPAPAGARPDLTGLTCRFDQAPSRRGVILSLIVRPADGQGSPAYRALVGDVLALVEASPDRARPVGEGGPPLAWPPSELDLQARAARRDRLPLLWHRMALLARTALSSTIFRLRLPMGRFDPARYMAALVANTDYRKYDDGLRMTIDCSLDLADVIEARLAAAEAAGIARHGTHRQAASLMTCITPSIHRSDHLHFVDGASGGYAAAAARLKG